MLCNSVLCVPSTEGSKILLLFITNNFIIVLVNTVFLRQTTGTPALVCHLLGCAVWLCLAQCWQCPWHIYLVPLLLLESRYPTQAAHPDPARGAHEGWKWHGTLPQYQSQAA